MNENGPNDKPRPVAPWKRVMIGVALGVPIGLLLPQTLDPNADFLALDRDDVPTKSLAVVIVVFLLSALFFVGGTMALVHKGRLRSSRGNRRVRLRRPAHRAGFGMLLWQLLMSAFLVATFRLGGWTWESVGLTTTLHPLISLAIGMVAYYGMCVALYGCLRAAGVANVAEDSYFEVLASIWPRSPRQKRLAMIAICVFNPIVEELIFRGILVHQFGLILGSATIPILSGLAAHLANHIYQGKWGLATHVPFFVLVTALLYSPAGLLGAIGFHVAGDLLPVRGMKEAMQRYRNRHRHRDAERQ